MFCTACGTKASDDASFCQNCGANLNASEPPQAPHTSITHGAQRSLDDAQRNLIRRLSESERVIGVLWVILGVLQGLSGVFFLMLSIFPIAVLLVACGMINLYCGRSKSVLATSMARRESTVPDSFRGLTGLVVMALFNLLFGAAIGVLLIIWELFIRDKVLSN
ncbi:MAG TPA: zinc ribbon domain-containing protein, partial [Burkholderiales bacterium]